MRQRLVLFALCLLATLPLDAEAGRRPFFWVYDTEVLPERMVELETWYWEMRNFPAQDADHASFWWSPVIGLTDQLELALPMELYWRTDPTGRELTRLETFGAELRYRFFPQTRDEGSRWVPLLRAGVKRLVHAPNVLQFEANLVAASDVFDRLHVALDVGYIGKTTGWTVFTGAAGASWALTDGLRVGAEAFAWVGVAGDTKRFLMLGPNFGYTLGPFWLTAGTLIGVAGDAAAIMPRVIWAATF